MRTHPLATLATFTALGLVPFALSCGLLDDPDASTTSTPIPPNTLATTQQVPPGFLEGQFCTVRFVFEVACVTGCHSALVPEAGLDLQTDPFDAIVYRPVTIGTGTLVVPRNLDESVLYQKMLGHQAVDQGGVMPPQGLVEPYLIAPIADWILAGSPLDCDPGVVEQTYTGDQPHHPPGWEASDVHGAAAKLQTDGDCRSCHGADLTGGTSVVSCDDCHAPGWRTDCTYCHGGQLNATGAPPKDIDGQLNAALISFPAHAEHVAGYDHGPFGCTQCHDKPTDALTPGHIFDDVTPGYGELDYTQGLSPIATYYGGTCSNVYCHGDGIVPGQITNDQTNLQCYDCHADQVDNTYWYKMSGRHQLHLDEGMSCSECHLSVVDANQVIINPAHHVDGIAEFQALTVAYAGGSCTGNCHDRDHVAENW